MKKNEHDFMDYLDDIVINISEEYQTMTSKELDDLIKEEFKKIKNNE